MLVVRRSPTCSGQLDQADGVRLGAAVPGVVVDREGVHRRRARSPRRAPRRGAALGQRGSGGCR